MKPARVEVFAGGAAHAVTIAPGDAPGRYRVAIGDGAPVEIDAVGVPENGGTTWSLRDVATGAVSTIALALGSNGDGDATVNGHTVPIALVTPRRSRARLAGAVDGEQRVVAPMPGKVVKVLVKIGDSVTPRQGLVVVEAMKMENELAAARAGTVTEVTVVEGASVDAGRLLVVVA